MSQKTCHILGHHEPIHVKFGVWGFFIIFYWNIVMKMLKCKKENLMTSHSVLYMVVLKQAVSYGGIETTRCRYWKVFDNQNISTMYHWELPNAGLECVFRMRSMTLAKTKQNKCVTILCIHCFFFFFAMA